MRIIGSIWNADLWATRGGVVKINWTQAPFIAYYRKFHAKACLWSSVTSSCNSNTSSWFTQELNPKSQERLKWVQNNYMIYNYCTAVNKFPLESSYDPNATSLVSKNACTCLPKLRRPFPRQPSQQRRSSLAAHIIANVIFTRPCTSFAIVRHAYLCHYRAPRASSANVRHAR
ncbi:hypothetical protein CsSME_00015464 [Camellia sinensis var. sinensis]